MITCFMALALHLSGVHAASGTCVDVVAAPVSTVSTSAVGWAAAPAPQIKTFR